MRTRTRPFLFPFRFPQLHVGASGNLAAMIEAVAIGPKDAVFSVFRSKGVSFVVAHTAKEAISLYETPDKLRALWVSASGAIHAGGKRYHTNASGTWLATKAPCELFALWGVDDDVFAGGMGGEILRRKGGAWHELANVEQLVTSIHGLGASSVHFVGDDLNGYFDGTSFTRDALPDGESSMFMQGVFCTSAAETWLCSSQGLYVARGREPATKVASANNDETYGVGLGAGGVFLHRGTELLRLEGETLVVVYENEAALLAKQGVFSNCITSNGRRVVAGGVRSVLVEDGAGFVEWPGLAPARPVPEPKAPPAKPNAKTAKPESTKKAPSEVQAKTSPKPKATR